MGSGTGSLPQLGQYLWISTDGVSVSAVYLGPLTYTTNPSFVAIGNDGTLMVSVYGSMARLVPGSQTVQSDSARSYSADGTSGTRTETESGPIGMSASATE